VPKGKLFGGAAAALAANIGGPQTAVPIESANSPVLGPLSGQRVCPRCSKQLSKDPRIHSRPNAYAKCSRSSINKALCLPLRRFRTTRQQFRSRLDRFLPSSFRNLATCKLWQTEWLRRTSSYPNWKLPLSGIFLLLKHTEERRPGLRLENVRQSLMGPFSVLRSRSICCVVSITVWN
jgi:hypothetical protein